MYHTCVPQNQAIGVYRGFVQVYSTDGSEDLVNVTITSNAEEEDKPSHDCEENLHPANTPQQQPQARVPVGHNGVVWRHLTQRCCLTSSDTKVLFNVIWHNGVVWRHLTQKYCLTSSDTTVLFDVIWHNGIVWRHLTQRYCLTSSDTTVLFDVIWHNGVVWRHLTQKYCLTSSDTKKLFNAIWHNGVVWRHLTQRYCLTSSDTKVLFNVIWPMATVRPALSHPCSVRQVTDRCSGSSDRWQTGVLVVRQVADRCSGSQTGGRQVFW